MSEDFKINKPSIIPIIAMKAASQEEPKNNDYIRASSFKDWCPRAEVIARKIFNSDSPYLIATGVQPGVPKSIPLNLSITFLFGSGLHKLIQEEVLIDHILGLWKCKQCGTIHGGDTKDAWVKKPEKCGCCQHKFFEFVEPFYVDVVSKLGGHIDGGFVLDGERVGLEFKTISPDQFEKLNQPLADQRHQAQVYMHIYDLPKKIFVYFSKGHHKDNSIKRCNDGFSAGPIKEFVVERDHMKMNQYLSLREKIELAIEKNVSKLPQRIQKCSGESSPRALKCPVKEICFNRSKNA